MSSIEFTEASYTLKSAAGDDFARHDGANAMSERIREWLDTPEGSVANNPSWGHNLTPFKHDPLSKDLDFQITLAITHKLPIDVEDIVLRGVNVAVSDIDMLNLSILHQFGATTLEIKL